VPKASLIRPVALCFLFLSLLLSASAQTAPTGFETLLKDLPWRNIGPAVMGGRIDDVAVVESNPSIVYLATASGGLFKTTNNGTTWEPLFDSQPTSSIGDVALAPSDPNIVWVGTGEANNRQSSSWGNGVYKSTDAGKTWQHMGLADTMHIGRVVVHPQNPDIVYVAAAGRLWGPNRERGLFKTTDGGKTWTNTLFIDEDTGCIDVALDPQNPDTLYAAMYQRRRTAYGFNGEGPSSALCKTTDGGKNWKKLTTGLPDGPTGRIGVCVYRKNPQIVYAIIENANGGVFRSEDRGETWKKMSSTNPRPMYYSQIHIDPNDDQRIWVLGAAMYVSEDGGKTFRTNIVTRVHSDFHALWINPANSDHMLTGSDGGIYWSYDRGRTWDFVNTIPLAQFYEITCDNQKPYYVYGGLQDNGSWCGPSATLTPQGPTNAHWMNFNGGDGFYVQVDPTDHHIIYTESQNGAVERQNIATGESKSIQPRAPAGEPPYRFDWNTPFLISPHNPEKILLGGNRLFISTDRGDSWRRTDDLTTQPDREKMPILGAMISRQRLQAYDGSASYGQIVTITESPRKAGLIYVGTDDGCLQVSRDDGQTWKNVADRATGVPKGTYVSRVAASHHAEGRCYAAFDGHRSNDFQPYVYVTEDYGETWRSITANLPEGGTVSVIREHHRNPNLLFVGTERGAYVSFDRGGRWHRFGAPLPTVPVDDIQIHPRDNDLILGTHGRGIWILDDITPLEQFAEQAMASRVCLFDPRPAVAYRRRFQQMWTGHKTFAAPNPPFGALIQFYLGAKPAEGETVRVTILEKDGKAVVRELRPLRTEAGLNRLTWDFRYRGLTPGGESGGRGGGPGEFGGLSGPRALPGTYLVRLTVGKETQTKPLRIEDDPRIRISAGDRRAQFNALKRLYGLNATVQGAVRSLRDLRTQITARQEAKAMEQAPPALKEALEALRKQVSDLNARLQAEPRGPQQGREEGKTQPPAETPPAPRVSPTVPLSSRLRQLFSSVDGITEAPSRAARQQIDEAANEVKRIVREINDLNGRAVQSVNRQLQASKMEPLKPGARIAVPR